MIKAAEKTKLKISNVNADLIKRRLEKTTENLDKKVQKFILMEQELAELDDDISHCVQMEQELRAMLEDVKKKRNYPTY